MGESKIKKEKRKERDFGNIGKLLLFVGLKGKGKRALITESRS